MGHFRFHRQLRLGIFKVNFSKTGIGYGIGCKGFSLVKTANGKTRMTNSLYGTGISYINEFGTSNKSNKYSSMLEGIKINSFANSNSKVEVISDTKKLMYLSIREYFATCQKLNWMLPAVFIICFYIPLIFARLSIMSIEISGIISTLLFLSFALYNVYYKVNGKVKLEYSYSDGGEDYLNNFNEMIKILAANDTIWKVHGTYDIDANERSWANKGVLQYKLAISLKAPDFIESNYLPYCLSAYKMDYYLYPDCIIYVEGKNISIIDLKENEYKFNISNIQVEATPIDALEIGKTYKHRNNDGTPDARFKDNSLLSIIMAGTMSITTKSGFNILLYLSSICKTQKLCNKISEMIKKYEKSEISDIDIE